MLPGDFIAMKLTGQITTSASALSEGILYDFKKDSISSDVMNYFGFDDSLIPEVQPLFSSHGKLLPEIAEQLSLNRRILPLLIKQAISPTMLCH